MSYLLRCRQQINNKPDEQRSAGGHNSCIGRSEIYAIEHQSFQIFLRRENEHVK